MDGVSRIALDVKSRTPGKSQKERQVALQFLGNQKIFLHVLMPLFPEFCRNFRVREQESNLIRRAFHGMSQQASMLVNNLNRNAADRRSYNRFFLPQCLGNGEAETFTQAFLNHNSGGPLQSVDFQRRPSWKFEYLDIGVVVRFAQDFFQDYGAFGIVRCAAACEDKLAIEISLHDTISADYAGAILQAVEPRNLGENCALGIDPVACENFGDEVPLEFLIFLRKRIDCWIEKILRNRELAGKFR